MQTTEGRRYRILGVLGKGGFGTVYRAELLGEGGFVRQVALKVLNPNVEHVGDVALRLRDEARILGMLRHRAILQVDGLVRLDDRWTVVMEFIEGVDLIAFRPRVIPTGPALEVISEVASALNIAFSWPGPDGQPLKLIHRDIKPPNILLTAAGETKVLDFGIARASFGAREAKTNSVMFGSPGYIAPERMDFVEGASGDVYSLGVVMFEILAGEPFGKAGARPERHNQIVDDALRRLQIRSIHRDVIDFVGDLVQYDADTRPTAREVETRCRDLRARVPGPWLRDWAEQQVPPMLVNRGMSGEHDFSNSVISEHASQMASDSSTMSFDAAEPKKSGLVARTLDDEAVGAPIPKPKTVSPGPPPPPMGLVPKPPPAKTGLAQLPKATSPAKPTAKPAAPAPATPAAPARPPAPGSSGTVMVVVLLTVVVIPAILVGGFFLMFVLLGFLSMLAA